MMKSNENILIVVLLVTAGILGAMMIGSWTSQKAYAYSADRTFGGDYIMVTGRIIESQSLLYVINIPEKKLLVYAADPARNTLVVVDDKVNLGNIFR